MFKLALLATAAFPVAFNDGCETVVIRTAGGDVRVNRSDYDADQAKGGEKKMRLASDAKQDDNNTASTVDQANAVNTAVAPEAQPIPAPSAPNFAAPVDSPAVQAVDPTTGAAVPTVPSPGQYFMVEEGTGAKKKIFVTRADGSKVDDVMGIDPRGYPSADDAMKAVAALPQN